MDAKSLIGGLIVGALSGSLVTLFLSNPAAPAIAHENEPSSEDDASAGELAATISENEQLRDQLAQLQKQLDETAVREAVAPPPTGGTEEAAAPPEAEPLTATIHYPGMDEALSEIDWTAAGKASSKMAPLMRELAEALANGESIADMMTEFAEIQRLNADLVAMVGPLTEAGVPGEGPNGKFTHPVVAANLMDAALSSSGIPLTADQRSTLQKLAAQFAGDIDMSGTQLGDDASMLDRVLASTELKDKFYEEARLALTPEQADRIAGGKGLPGFDLFSSGLVWQQFQRPVNANDPAEFADDVHSRVRRALGLSGDQAKLAGQVVDEWTNTVPFDSLADLSNLPAPLRGGDVRAAARRQAALRQMLATRLGLTPAQVRAMDDMGVLVPIRTQ